MVCMYTAVTACSIEAGTQAELTMKAAKPVVAKDIGTRIAGENVLRNYIDRPKFACAGLPRC